MSTLSAVETYPAWLEIEIGLDSHAVALSHERRTELFEERIKQGLEALERACPGIGSKLEVFPGRPFAFTGSLAEEEIRAIWHLPELRLLADRGDPDPGEPQPDELGMRPFIISVHQYIQAEASAVINVEAYTLLVNAKDEEDAKTSAVDQCSSAMPEHFMGSDYVIHRRWWTAEHTHVNSWKEDVRSTFGSAVVLDRRTVRKKKEGVWRPDGSIEGVTYGSPAQRPKEWEWMLG
ncbi:MAG: hypothetical protein E6Q44_04750 [Flavobacteriales bacterium]|jgi:hypothetical protein|nr:MAG: hypothetical protein E6Q44_04750 [Flavobacteriales bacterium]